MDTPLKNASADRVSEHESLLIKGQLIDGQTLSKKLNDAAIVPWTLNDFEQEEQQKEADKKAEIRQEVEKQIQPELKKRSDMLRKEVYDSAYQEGYDAGFKLGEEEGKATGKSQAYSQARDFLFPKIQSIDELLKNLQAPQQQMQQNLFDEIVQFSAFIAEQLLGEQLSRNPDWLYRVVQEAIQTLPESEAPIEVALNADDLAFLQELETAWLKNYHCKADPAILPGGCMVKQQFSSIHHCWQNRFLALKEQLTNNVQSLTDSQQRAMEAAQQNQSPTFYWDEDSEFGEEDFAPLKTGSNAIPEVSEADFPAKKSSPSASSDAEPIKSVKDPASQSNNE
ncbi:hypothetical protein THMIRHAS_09130 [Thiosulfatimonas sediminis]|uniref:Flagellar assembly protein FliH n=1 Tax=Thiosulfatimonas sediminis TaxID=2675054 RepID=A0A6F8PU87_9GAMM|nr:FliH/SctL family protein [Thiosulfatimonas sediminis]BBP45540.1 hypothetical protein THMIRHAS_09130 [Thiosulfatimonas sediminis]